ncbi:hypothetical protein LBMAG53_16470 [Planctomycetota bacterium]|nr:hypothetical protein LBMAG53_16470 [Planctomycetota bacterium]
MNRAELALGAPRLALGAYKGLFCAITMALAAAIAAEPVTVPPAVAATVQAAQASDSAGALAVIAKHPGPPHPLIDLVAAQAHLTLAEAVGDPAQEKDRESHAAEARRLALAVLNAEPANRPAHVVLARLAVRAGDWRTASREAAASFDLGNADAAQLGFLADCARRAGDHRLAAMAVSTGILRFPQDRALRRIDLALCIDSGRAEDARTIVLDLLAESPADPALWRNLAWCAQATNRMEESLAALEAALACRDEPGLRRQLAETQAARDLPQAALATIRPLLSVKDPEPAVVLSAARIASAAGDPAQGRAWLALVPAAKRTRDHGLLVARLAVQVGDRAAAGTALDTLIAAGEADPAVLTWAGQLAEQLDQPARAEALYQQAAGGEGRGPGRSPAAAAAGLRLAALYLRQNRRDEAALLIAAHLARQPDDQQALALQAALNTRKNTAR